MGNLVNHAAPLKLFKYRVFATHLFPFLNAMFRLVAYGFMKGLWKVKSIGNFIGIISKIFI